MWLTINELRGILYNNNNVCCLCFEATGDDALRVSDEVSLDSGHTLDLSTIIYFVLENKISEVEFISQAVCEKCVQSAICAYKFVKKCTKANEKFTNVLCNLTNSLETADNDCLAKVKGMYIAADPESSKNKVYYDSKRAASSISVILKRFQALLHSELNNTKRNTSDQLSKRNTDDALPLISQKLQCKCGNSFRNKHSLNKHKRLNCKVNKENDWDDKAHKHKIKLRLYFQKLERVSCKYCGSSSSNKYNLKKHLLKNCKIFKETVPAEDVNNIIELLLNVHKKKRQTKKNQLQQNERVSCDYCEQYFRTKSILKIHIHNHCKKAPFESKQSVCIQCGIVVNKHRMALHESTHTSHFECSKCGKVFKTEKSYKKHQLIPNCNEKPVEFIKPTKDFSCHICGYQFAAKRSLIEHFKARHSGRGFECVFCKKKLATKHALKLHMVVHTKEKNFECGICGGKFVSKHSLLYHTRTHTGEKPYKCKFCDNRFLSASRRNIHIRIHHLPPQLECKLCPKKFTNWGTRTRHMKRHFNPSSSLYLGNLPDYRQTDKKESVDEF